MSTEMGNSKGYLKKYPPQGRIPLDKLSTKVLGLSTRAYRALRNVNINTLQQLIDCTESDLLRVYGLEVTTANQIKTRLDSYVVARLIAGDWDAELVKVDSWLLRRVLEPSTPIVDRYLVMQLKTKGVPLDRISIDALGLDRQAYDALRNANLRNIQQLVNCTEGDLLKLRNLGPSTVNEIRGKSKHTLSTILESGYQNLLSARSDHNELSALVSQLCNDFERYRLLDDLKLPSDVRRDLCCAIGEEPATLADLRRLVESNDFQNRPPGSDDARSHAFERAVVWFQHILSFESVDDEIDALLRYLNNKERYVLANRFGIHAHLTLEQIGGRFGITREGVRQIQTKVPGKLNNGISRMPLFYSTAALILLRRQGENASLQSWKELLTDILFVKEESSADLLVAVSRAAHSSRLVLPQEWPEFREYAQRKYPRGT